MRRGLSGNEITRQILGYFKVRGIFAVRINNVGVWDNAKKIYRKSSNTTKGIADIQALHAGQFYAIEVKGTGDKLSEHQETYLEAVTDNGGVSIVAKDLDDVMAVFEPAILRSP